MAGENVYVPKLRGAVEGYIVNYQRRNYWRVKKLLTWEEFLQEGLEVFCRVAKAYPNTKSPKHFMSLLQTALHRRVNSLSNKDTLKRKPEDSFCDVFNGDYAKAEASVVYTGGVDFNDGHLLVMLEEAPEEVRSVINLMLGLPREWFDLLINMWRAGGKKKEHGNEFLCEMLGQDSTEVDLVTMVQEYFK